MKTTRRRGGVTVGFCGLLFLSACGAQSMPGAGTGGGELGDQQREFERLEGELNRQLSPPRSQGQTDSPAPAVGAGADAEETVAEEAVEDPGGMSAAPGGAEDEGCDGACRSLAALRRVRDRICRLAPDEPCTKADESVEHHEERVRSAGCGCAADGSEP